MAREHPVHRSRQDAVRPHEELATLLQLARRDVCRLSHEELARQLGGGDTSSLARRIESYERAEELPGEDEARRLSEVLELDPARLVALVRAPQDPSGLQRCTGPCPDEPPPEAPWRGSTRSQGWMTEPVALVGSQRTLQTSGVLPPAAAALADWLGTA